MAHPDTLQRFRFSLALCALCSLGACTGCGDDHASSSSDCIADHPSSGSPVVASAQLDQVVADCVGDSGECQASTTCSGSVSNRQCDASHFITAQAATCIAETRGLDQGLQGLSVTLVYNAAYRRVVWNVSNVLYDRALGQVSADDVGDSGGESLSVDATSGEAYELLSWQSILN